MELAAEFTPEPWCQTVKPIDGPLGWLQYLAKHGARGVGHYQRQGKPAGWEKTGRMWGKSGSWPVVAWERAEVTTEQMWRLRRLVHRWVVAQARGEVQRYESAGRPRKAAAARKRLVYVRRMLQNPDRAKSSYRGIAEWVPLSVQWRILEHVGWDGTLKEAVA